MSENDFDTNIDNFRNELKNLFEELASTKTLDSEEAFEDLQSVQESLDTDFEVMKDSLHQLRLISAKL